MAWNKFMVQYHLYFISVLIIFVTVLHTSLFSVNMLYSFSWHLWTCFWLLTPLQHSRTLHLAINRKSLNKFHIWCVHIWQIKRNPINIFMSLLNLMVYSQFTYEYYTVLVRMSLSNIAFTIAIWIAKERM